MTMTDAMTDICTVQSSVAPLHVGPDVAALYETEVMLGERIMLEGYEGPWLRARTEAGDVGYLHPCHVTRETLAFSHRVCAASTVVRKEPKTVTTLLTVLPMHARVSVHERAGRFCRTDLGWIFEGDLRPLDENTPDWVAECEKFIGIPYVWGGRNGMAGVDCSGLIVNGLASIGVHAQHSSGWLEANFGTGIAHSRYVRGDLVFWKGHVGVMLDSNRLLHASGDAMRVVIEPLHAVESSRIASGSGPITSVRRLNR